jgi:hypothetical protein
MYLLGNPITITIDDRIPVDGNGRPLFA